MAPAQSNPTEPLDFFDYWLSDDLAKGLFATDYVKVRPASRRRRARCARC